MDDSLDLEFAVTYRHRIFFTEGAFAAGNRVLADLFAGAKVIPIVDAGLANARPGFAAEVAAYGKAMGIHFTRAPLVLTGGEAAKKDSAVVKAALAAIEADKICRHSYVLAIGGGAFLDAVGFAASTAHRGVRLVRFPTTTLSQDDSGVGVKSAINAFGKKNWIGSFCVPFAVINDFRFLETQDRETSRAGLIEAIKVALVKDGDFFAWIEKNAAALAKGERDPFEECVKRSALLHARHIALGGDAFETGSSRPLDFGHWAAHKLEALTNYQLSHAEAVSVGLALDTIYSRNIGLLAETDAARVLAVLAALGLKTYPPALDWMDRKGQRRVHAGLDEFREHLGGELTVLLLADIGKGTDVHEFNMEQLEKSIAELHSEWDRGDHFRKSGA
jgi:3-dehydroquinate synthase